MLNIKEIKIAQKLKNIISRKYNLSPILSYLVDGVGTYPVGILETNSSFYKSESIKKYVVTTRSKMYQKWDSDNGTCVFRSNTYLPSNFQQK